MTIGNTTTSRGKQEALGHKNKSGTSNAAQQLKRQQCDVGGSFGGRWVAAVALVAALAMALPDQWQRWVRQQSNKKQQSTNNGSVRGGQWLAREHQQPHDPNGGRQQTTRACGG
jgi:hypothetical protein